MFIATSGIKLLMDFKYYCYPFYFFCKKDIFVSPLTDHKKDLLENIREGTRGSLDATD